MENKSENLGVAIDEVDNLAQALNLEIPAELHVKALKGSLPEAVLNLKNGFIELTGEDPWDISEKSSGQDTNNSVEWKITKPGDAKFKARVLLLRDEELQILADDLGVDYNASDLTVARLLSHIYQLRMELKQAIAKKKS